MQIWSPIYIPTKGRHESLITTRALDSMGIRHFLIVEPQEVDTYHAALKSRGVKTAEILPLDLSYKARYETCDSKGLSISTGSGPARNFGWEHSIAIGAKSHWMVDDNCQGFFILIKNRRIKALDRKSFFEQMERFAVQFSNLAMCGPEYKGFVMSRTQRRPLGLNGKNFSCNLIRNDVPFRWRGRYNEDVILGLDMLKAGWCTAIFYAFLSGKIGTKSLKGGNTTELYGSGTLDKSKMLISVHPDVSRLRWWRNRIHHAVDYSGFTQKLIRADVSDEFRMHSAPSVVQIRPAPQRKGNS